MERVSSLSGPLCHPDINANGTTGQQLVPIGSAHADYPLAGICEHFPLHPSTSPPAETTSFHEASDFHLSTLRARGKTLRESSCYQLKLATGQPPFPSVNKDIKSPRATPAACARSRQSTDKVVREAGKVLFHYAKLRVPALPRRYMLSSETSCDNPSKLGYTVATFPLSEWRKACRKAAGEKKKHSKM